MKVENVRVARVYRGEGSTRLLVRLDFPRLCDSGEGCERINNMYRKIADLILDSPGSLTSVLGEHCYTLTHTYELEETDGENGIISVHRTLTLSLGTRELSRQTAVDTLSLLTGLEVRHRKGKKKEKALFRKGTQGKKDR